MLDSDLLGEAVELGAWAAPHWMEGPGEDSLPLTVLTDKDLQLMILSVSIPRKGRVSAWAQD